LFFTSIPSERAFSLSQLSGLRFVSDRLKHLEVLPSIIDKDVPARDVSNLLAFEAFYSNLEQEEKSELASELTLALVMQAGAVYAQKEQKPCFRKSSYCAESPLYASQSRLFSPVVVRVREVKNPLQNDSVTCNNPSGACI
jgi:hypothetical protein